MGTLTVRLFGGLFLERNQVILSAPTPQKAALLLAYLLTAYNRTHPRNLLAGLFWGDLPEPRARRNLSNALWSIRLLLKGDAEGRPGAGTTADLLLMEGDTVRLNPTAPVDLDVRHMEELLRGPADRAAHERVVELYRGDLLVGYYDDWVLLERERLRQMYLASLHQLVVTYKAQGAWEAAVSAAQRIVQADPYQEEATRELMRLHYRLSRRDRALQQFATLKAVLAADLQLEPEPETVTLYQMIQAGQMPNLPETGAPRGSGRPYAPAGGGVPASGPPTRLAMSTLRSNLRSVPLVGRRVELDSLGEWLGNPHPDPPMLLLQGETGVGKTRLAQAAADEAYRRRMFVLWGHYHPLAAPLPYAGLVEALRIGMQLGGVPPLDPLWLTEVSRLLPELGEQQPDLPLPIRLPPDLERLRLWEALTRYLLALASAGPHMFVLEDVQWVDPATLDLLQYALPRLRSSGTGLRLLVTARSEDLANAPALDDALRGLEAQGMLGRLSLDRLSAEAFGTLVEEALGLERPAPLFSAHLWRETEGNPFFALETIRFWAERGLLRQESDGNWYTRDDDPGGLPTPASVWRVLEQRLDRLSPAARALVEVGAVLGRQVPEHLLALSSGSTPGAVVGPAEELLRQQLWVEAPDGQGYQFAHQKVVEVAYAGISSPRRRHLHRMVAGALESAQPSQAAGLAHHWLTAEDPERALPYLLDVAGAAAATFANDEALVFYNQAMQAIDKLSALDSPAVAERIYLALAGRGALHSRMGLMAQAVDDLDRLVTLARQGGSPGRIADALAQRSGLAIAQARYSDARKDLNEALDLAQRHQQANALTRILTELARVALRSGQHSEAIDAAQRALANARATGDLRMEVEALSILGSTYGLAGQRDPAVAILEEALEKVAQVPNSLHLEARLLNNLSIFVASPQTSYDLFLRALEIAERTGVRSTQATAHQNLAELLTRFGRPAAALAHLDRAHELITSSGADEALGMLLMTRGQARAQLGDVGAARRDLQEAAHLLETVGALYDRMTALHDLGDFLLDQGEFVTGREYIERSVALWQTLGRPEGAYRAARYEAQRARAEAGRRRAGAARRAVQQALVYLDEARLCPVVWTDPSVEVLAHCYSVLAGIHRPVDAGAVLARGYTLMLEMADRCGPELRASYLEGIHECRILRAAWETRAAPPARVPPDASALPTAADPLATPPAQDSRKVTRRRAEVLIMVRDAASRGQAPAEDDLARHFGVSRRTIERDLVGLRRAGHLS